jgi:nicotinamidase-related amidase
MASYYQNTAVLSLDVQLGIIGQLPAAQAAIPRGASIVATARTRGHLLIHVGLGFAPGYPEIHPRHPRFGTIKERGAFILGSESARIHPSLYQPGDLVVHKHRVGAFSGNALSMILAANGIETLVLFGFSTSGVVLSTLRLASDLDFQCVVIADACADGDEEVHRVLTTKVFPRQATVLSTQDFLTPPATTPPRT